MSAPTRETATGAIVVADPTTSPAPGAARPAGVGEVSRRRVLGRAAWRALSPLVVCAVAAAVVWYGFLLVFDISPLIGKTPADVLSYLATDGDAAANRAAVLAPLGETLFDAAVSFATGMAAALVFSLLFVLSPPVEQSMMPVAMLLRSVPLVAMTPLIFIVFERGLSGTAVMGGIVVVFPALVLIVQGLRSVTAQTRDLVVAYGGSELTVLTRVGLPTAMPSLLAAARISVPGALTGALVAEWLGTGRGIGSSILAAIGGFRYDELWASITVLTATSVLLYSLVGVLEQAVLARYAPHALQR